MIVLPAAGLLMLSNAAAAWSAAVSNRPLCHFCRPPLSIHGRAFIRWLAVTPDRWVRCSALAAAAPLQLVPGLQAVLACVHQLHCLCCDALAGSRASPDAVPRCASPCCAPLRTARHTDQHSTVPHPLHTPPLTPPTAVPRRVPLPRIAAPKSTGQQLGATAVAGTIGQPRSLVSWRWGGRRLLWPACD